MRYIRREYENTTTDRLFSFLSLYEQIENIKFLTLYKECSPLLLLQNTRRCSRKRTRQFCVPFSLWHLRNLIITQVKAEKRLFKMSIAFGAECKLDGSQICSNGSNVVKCIIKACGHGCVSLLNLNTQKKS